MIHVKRVPVIVITRHMVLPVKSLMRRVYNGANAVICPSRAVRDYLRDQGISEQKLELIYNAIDTDEFAWASENGALVRAEFQLEQDEICIGCVGRLVRGKGHDNLLKAAAQLNNTGTRIKFLIIGDGINRSTLQARAEQLGIADKVVFAGYRSDMPAVMCALDVFTLPSNCAEGLPMALIEAMAAGRAVVATRVGGVSEIVEHEKSGLLVPPRDSNALAESLQRLIVDSSLRERLGVAAKKRAQQRFALPRKIADTERIYERLLYHRAYHEVSQRDTVGEGKPTPLDQN
jgi:glycosyltransferase involved in cell wall biosynthesis